MPATFIATAAPVNPLTSIRLALAIRVQANLPDLDITLVYLNLSMPITITLTYAVLRLAAPVPCRRQLARASGSIVQRQSHAAAMPHLATSLDQTPAP